MLIEPSEASVCLSFDEDTGGFNIHGCSVNLDALTFKNCGALTMTATMVSPFLHMPHVLFSLLNMFVT